MGVLLFVVVVVVFCFFGGDPLTVTSASKIQSREFPEGDARSVSKRPCITLTLVSLSYCSKEYTVP